MSFYFDICPAEIFEVFLFILMDVNKQLCEIYFVQCKAIDLVTVYNILVINFMNYMNDHVSLFSHFQESWSKICG